MSDYEDPITVVEGEAEVPYAYSTGYEYRRFFDELANNERIMGRKCPDCESVLVPPRSYCGVCFTRTREWKEVGPEAHLLGYGVVHQEFPGQPSDPPYVYVELQFEGSHTKVPHILGGADIDEIREGVAVGATVRPVFEPPEERTGDWDDVQYFELVE
jgi:hypothetical protein